MPITSHFGTICDTINLVQFIEPRQMKKKTAPFHLRMPPSLHEQLNRECKELGMSLNALIVQKLEGYNELKYVADRGNESRPHVYLIACDLFKVLALFTCDEVRNCAHRLGVEGAKRLSKKDATLAVITKGLLALDDYPSDEYEVLKQDKA